MTRRANYVPTPEDLRAIRVQDFPETDDDVMHGRFLYLQGRYLDGRSTQQTDLRAELVRLDLELTRRGVRH